MTGRRSVLAALVLSTSGCYRNAEPVRHMWTHYEQVGDVQTAVIRGDVERARRSARWIAEHQGLDGMPPEAAPFTTAMRDAARGAESAQGVSEAARMVGRMGRACGDCHRATIGSLGLFIGSEPNEGHTALGTRMIRHLWAADRLWDGLVGPSAEMWSAGASALAESPFDPTELGASGGNPEIRRLADEVHQLGIQAVGVTDAEHRADLYGRLLLTCARCHTAQAE